MGSIHRGRCQHLSLDGSSACDRTWRSIFGETARFRSLVQSNREGLYLLARRPLFWSALSLGIYAGLIGGVASGELSLAGCSALRAFRFLEAPWFAARPITSRRFCPFQIRLKITAEHVTWFELVLGLLGFKVLARQANCSRKVVAGSCSKLLSRSTVVIRVVILVGIVAGLRGNRFPRAEHASAESSSGGSAGGGGGGWGGGTGGRGRALQRPRALQSVLPGSARLNRRATSMLVGVVVRCSASSGLAV